MIFLLKTAGVFIFMAFLSLSFSACKKHKKEIEQLKILNEWSGAVEKGELEKIVIPFLSNISEMSLYNKSLLFQQEKLDTSYVVWNIMDASGKYVKFGQIGNGLADKQVRKATHNGTAKVDDFDPSELKQISNLIHITPMLSNSSMSKGTQRTTTYTFKLLCNPLSAKNNAPLDEFQQFSVQFSADVKTLTDRFGRTKVGLRFDDLRAGSQSARIYEDFQLRQGRAAIVQFFVHMYKIFPVGGVVTNFDEDGRVNIKANRANGLQKNMEFVVFAAKKGDPDAIPVPLYNATAVMVSQTKNSTLQVWRKSEKKSAVKIIKLIESDIDAARDEYEFFAAADGFAEWPDFVQQHSK